MAKRYMVYAGNGKVSPSSVTSFIDAGTLASLYGLSPADYDVGPEVGQPGTTMDSDHIHLRPRPDGKYLNIKTELGDTGIGYKLDYPVGWKKNRRIERNIL
jgi:hypothetical protein